MNARVYLNTSTNSATARIDGGGFSPPPIRAYSDVMVRFRLSREIEGESVPDDREIDSVSARIGYPDSAPTSGTVTLDITVGGDTVTTAAVAFDATAATLATAINTALDSSALDALHPATVESLTEGYSIIFADTAETVTVEAGSNKLRPLSFVNADRVAFDGGWATILAYRQAAVAETAVAVETVPPVPTVAREQAGNTTDGVALNEIQKITLNPAYAGATWRLVWDGVKGSILPGFPTVEQIQASLDELAPTGGIFTLLAVEDGVLVEFAGTMAGEGQELMTTEEFTAPPTEYLVTLPTATAAMRTMMAGAGTDNEIELPMDITVVVLDDDAPDGEQKLIFPFELTFTRPVGDDSRNVSAGLDYTQPLSRTSNQPFSTNSLLVGNRAMRFTIGDGSATSFLLAHNLGSLSANFTANASTDICTSAAHNLHNGDPVTLSSTTTLPAGLSAGVTYFVISATTDTFQLAATPGGSAINITSTGTGTHTFLVADGTTDAVFVEVWEKAGGLSRISPEDYTVVRTTANSVTVSGFASTPTANKYEVIVMTAGRPATYQAHTHPVAEITGLQAIIDGINSRLSALELVAPADFGLIISAGTFEESVMLPDFYELYDYYGVDPERPDDGLLSSLDLSGIPSYGGQLFAAVHDASVTALSTTTSGSLVVPVAASASYIGSVFQNQTGDVVDIDGTDLEDDGFAACDGTNWYIVEKYAAAESSYYPATFERTLWTAVVSDLDLISGRMAEVMFDLGAMTIRANTPVYCQVVIEYATLTADASPGTPGGNVADDAWVETPVMSFPLDLTSTPRHRSYGYRVTRSGDTLTAYQLRSGVWAAATAPSATRFALRARLVRFDTANDVDAPEGYIAIIGPRNNDSTDGVGYLSIS